MSSSLKTDEMYIGSPVFPYAYFPYYHEKKQVPFALLYTGKYTDTEYGYNLKNYIGEMKSDEIEKLCQNIKEELSLKYLDWGYCAGRCLLTISLDDLPKVYDIAKAFIKRKCRIYMQDATQVTFSNVEEISYGGQQNKLLTSLLQLESYGSNIMDLCRGLPIHRDAFWCMDEGKKLAERLRKTHNLKDVCDPNDMYIGEYFGEFLPKKQNEKLHGTIPGGIDVQEEVKMEVDKEKKKDDEPNDCIICCTNKANTLVLPCMHVVVCKECSNKLETDELNAHKCVMCRQNIESVLEDQE